MLNVHCNTVQRERERKKWGGKKKSHTHWHVNIQADGVCSRGSRNLIDKLGTSLGHKTDIPILGSKQWLSLQGRHESLAGEGGPPTDSCTGPTAACSGKEGGWQSPAVQETPQEGCHLEPQLDRGYCPSMHRPALAKDSCVSRCGDPKSRTQLPLGRWVW